MLNHVHCCVCGKRACDVEHVVTINSSSICNECVCYAGRKMGILPPPELSPESAGIEVEERLAETFLYTLELDGHIDQKYDAFLVHCLLDVLRAEYWNIAIEIGGIRRTDGFRREAVAEGRARYALDLIVRTIEPISEEMLRIVLEDAWATLTSSNRWLVHDKGTRDLLSPRLSSLTAYVLQRITNRR